MESESCSLRPVDVHGPAHVVSERWRKWTRSFLYYVDGKGITDKGRRKALLLHLAGEGVQDIFDSLASDLEDDPADPFKQLVDVLNDYFKVEANEPYERHVFRQLHQLPSETATQFVTRLRNQAVFCNFKDSEDQIRDQFIQAMRDHELRQKLLEERNIKLGDALDRARHKEMSASQAATMESNQGNSEVASTLHFVQRKKPRQPGATREGVKNGQGHSSRSDVGSGCYACGRKGHFARSPECPARGKSCKSCQSMRRFAKSRRFRALLLFSREIRSTGL